MKRAFIFAFIIAALGLNAENTYQLTAEEYEAGFAIRQAPDEEQSDAAINSGGTSAPMNGSTAGGLGSNLGGGMTVAQIKAALLVALPVLAKITFAAAATAVILKYGTTIAMGAVTAVCAWFGVPLDVSAAIGLSVPTAGSWLKSKFKAKLNLPRMQEV
ncbi:MAG: hypothetical protein V4534_08480 [Myxococcota bacterium]